MFGAFLDDLYTTSSCTYYCDPFILKIHSFLRPVLVVSINVKTEELDERLGIETYGCMMDDPLENFHSFHLWDVRLGSETNSRYEPPSPRFRPVPTFNRPFMYTLTIVKSSRFHRFVVLCTFREMDFRIDVVEIPTEFISVRVTFSERKVLPDLFVKQLIQWGVRIDSRSCRPSQYGILE